MKLSKISTAILACVTCAAFASQADARELRMAHSHVEDDPTHLSFVAFGEKLKELSGGGLTVTIFANGQLGGEREVAEQVLNGALDISMVGGQVIETFFPRYAVTNIPYLFRSFEHVQHFIKSDIAYKYLLDASADEGFKGLWFETCGPRSFYTKKPVNKPEDLDGLKMRVPESQMSIDTVKLMGGQPTPLSSTEVYSALQQSVIDGAENNFVYYVQSRHFEVAKYFNEDEHSMPPNVVIMSQYTWDDLSEQEQQWVTEAAKYARDEQMRLFVQQTDENKAKAKELGIEIVTVDKAPFVEKTKSILENEMKNPDRAELIKAIQELQ